MPHNGTVLISTLIPFFERADHFTALAAASSSAEAKPPDALTTARLAHQMGETELGRALLARTGGLLDTADAQTVLEEPLPSALMQAARASQSMPPNLPQWTAGEREMFIRVLAAYLLSDDPRAEPQPVSGRRDIGLWVFPARNDLDRWARGLQILNDVAPGAEGAHVPPSTWTSASWGSRWGIRRFLTAQGPAPGPGDTSVDVESNEALISNLSAAYSWNLPRLIRLLSRPLLIDGLQGLSQATLETLAGLLADAARVFGWTVIGLPGVERTWPAAFTPWPAPALGAPVDRSGEARAAAGPTADTFRLRVWNERPTLEWLARTVQQAPGRTLVMLPSRGSAARFTGLVGDAALLSTSLCPVHLDDCADALAQDGAVRCVVATTLPSTQIGQFDHVWHLMAPLPYLVEAAALCSGDFNVLSLVDVAVPLAWTGAVQQTAALLEKDPAALGTAEIHRAYYALNKSPRTEEHRAALQTSRLELNYTSLASGLQPRAEHSVPVLIPYSVEARQTIARLGHSDWLSPLDLRYAAWLTPSEATRAVQRGDAQPSGWPLIWTAAYHPVYGLAARVVAQTQARE